MKTVFTYGSLLSADERRKTFNEDVPTRIARLLDYKRHFGQEPMFRDDNVLSVHPVHGHYCNGLLLRLDEEQYDSYLERETGYQMREVPSFRIITTDRTPETVYVAVGDEVTDDYQPDNTYKHLCLSAAIDLGDDFCSEFVRTTFQTREDNKLAYKIGSIQCNQLTPDEIDPEQLLQDVDG